MPAPKGRNLGRQGTAGEKAVVGLKAPKTNRVRSKVAGNADAGTLQRLVCRHRATSPRGRGRGGSRP